MKALKCLSKSIRDWNKEAHIDASEQSYPISHKKCDHTLVLIHPNLFRNHLVLEALPHARAPPTRTLSKLISLSPLSLTPISLSPFQAFFLESPRTSLAVPPRNPSFLSPIWTFQPNQADASQKCLTSQYFSTPPHNQPVLFSLSKW